MKHSKSDLNEKSFRTFMIKRKISQVPIEIETEKDYILEKKGDFSKYLENETGLNLGPRFTNGKVISHSIIGPSALFSAKKIETIEKAPKKYSFDAKEKNHSNLSKPTETIDHQKRFNEVMKRINQAKETSAFEEQEKLAEAKKNSLNKDPVAALKLKLKNLELNDNSQRTYQKALKNHLSLPFLTSREKNRRKNKRKTEKSDGKIEKNKFEGFPEVCPWYMSLRNDDRSEKIDTYVTVGNPLNGLYLKIAKRNPNFKLSSLLEKTDRKKRIEVIGSSKLNLEIEAIKKVGFEALKPELLQTSKFDQETIFEENYDTLPY